MLGRARALLVFLTSSLLHDACAAGYLQVEHAWIRLAPPGSMMLAAYAQLRNVGDAAIVVDSVTSRDFSDASMHQSIEENGVERMRALDAFHIAPGTTVLFAPGGKHFMLMQPRRALNAGDSVEIAVHLRSGEEVVAKFVVRENAPGVP